MNKIKSIAKRYSQLLKKSNIDYATLGNNYLNDFEGMDHQALMALAEGTVPQSKTLIQDFGDNEKNAGIAEKIREVYARKYDIFKKAALEMAPLDKEILRIVNEAYGEDASEDIAGWAKHYPMLTQQD
jgi:hypothetical protein